ncbi:hypothetical protein BC939DRAFT_433918 [Gamsiella multidivaricata]|uniref:uncharacterized protein n=1 Tax=Gamsiella multidivaricata TaxID=101098 RepID=UPI0022202A28|nr:uncharacterized protein BC939DRAFT_433918 [Gamsiella multidivaricata]KAI7832630.1 hypothetical protein BC939DRAFT_433918 [Gamsiella multidivaricata]
MTRLCARHWIGRKFVPIAVIPAMVFLSGQSDPVTTRYPRPMVAPSLHYDLYPVYYSQCAAGAPCPAVYNLVCLLFFPSPFQIMTRFVVAL